MINMDFKLWLTEQERLDEGLLGRWAAKAAIPLAIFLAGCGGKQTPVGDEPVVASACQTENPDPKKEAVWLEVTEGSGYAHDGDGGIYLLGKSQVTGDIKNARSREIAIKKAVMNAMAQLNGKRLSVVEEEYVVKYNPKMNAVFVITHVRILGPGENGLEKHFGKGRQSDENPWKDWKPGVTQSRDDPLP